VWFPTDPDEVGAIKALVFILDEKAQVKFPFDDSVSFSFLSWME
jgi:hypothetical protein